LLRIPLLFACLCTIQQNNRLVYDSYSTPTWKSVLPTGVYLYKISKIWYIFEVLGIQIFDLAYMTNFVYIFRRVWLRFKPIHLVYYKEKQRNHDSGVKGI